MSASFFADGNELGVTATNGICRAFALYQDSAARIEVMRMCNQLLDRFSNDLFFDFSWLNYQGLADPVLAVRANEALDWADIVIFCGHADDLPITVTRWLDDMVASGKQSPKKTIAWLPADPAGVPEVPGSTQHCLQTVATTLGMRFLSFAAPGDPAFDSHQHQSMPIPPSSDQSTDDLQSRWGLNE